LSFGGVRDGTEVVKDGMALVKGVLATNDMSAGGETNVPAKLPSCSRDDEEPPSEHSTGVISSCRVASARVVDFAEALRFLLGFFPVFSVPDLASA